MQVRQGVTLCACSQTLRTVVPRHPADATVCWHSPRSTAGKYEDPLGLSLPPAAGPFCDAWKRSEELLQGLPAVPMVCLRPAAAGDPSPAENTKKGVSARVPPTAGAK